MYICIDKTLCTKRINKNTYQHVPNYNKRLASKLISIFKHNSALKLCLNDVNFCLWHRYNCVCKQRRMIVLLKCIGVGLPNGMREKHKIKFKKVLLEEVKLRKP